MTQAFNLSQFANFVDTNGKLTASTGVTGTLPVANGGTGLATLTSNALLTGNGTGNVTAIPAATAGYVLTSNGTSWAGQIATKGAINGIDILTTSATWTVPPGITSALVELYGGGGAGYYISTISKKGGAGGYVKCYISGLTPGASFSINIGLGGVQGSVTPTDTYFDTYARAYAGTNATSTDGTDGSGIVNTGTLIRAIKQTTYTGMIGTLGGLVVNDQTLTGSQPYTVNFLYSPGAYGNGRIASTSNYASGIGGAAVIQY